MIATIATVPPATPPAMAATLGLEDEGVAVTVGAAAARAQVDDWQTSHDRTTC